MVKGQKKRSVYSAFYVWAELLSLGSLNRASICARTAVNALVRVNYVLAVLLADSLNGAFLSASAASDAIIIDFVSHNTLRTGIPVK